MRMKRFLLIMLALLLAFSMSAIVFADEEEPVDENVVTAVEDEDEDEDATEEEDVVLGGAFEIPVPESVVVSTQRLTIDGELVDVQPYNIDGANYFKLRDLAALLTGTGSQFNVDYAAPNMIVTTGEAYTPIDGDLVKGEDLSATCVPSSQVLLVDGEQVDVLVYNIGGNNYFQLAGLGDLVGFEVSYDSATRTMIVETADYDPDAADEDDDEADDEDDDEEDDDEEDDEE